MVTKTAMKLSDLLTGMELLKEISVGQKAETAKLVIRVISEEPDTYQKEIEAYEAKVRISKLVHKLLLNRTPIDAAHAENIEILDQEARESLGFSILPEIRCIAPDSLQILRLNVLKKIKETIEKGGRVDNNREIMVLAQNIAEDGRLESLGLNNEVIVEMLLDLLS